MDPTISPCQKKTGFPGALKEFHHSSASNLALGGVFNPLLSNWIISPSSGENNKYLNPICHQFVGQISIFEPTT